MHVLSLRSLSKTIMALAVVVFSNLLWATPSLALTEPRLIGHWLSDIERTAFLRRYELAQEDETLEKFEDVYGQLHKVITPTHITLWRDEKPNEKYTGRYRVVARDAQSVVIQTTSPKGKTQLTQIFFDSKGHYVLGGHRVEFFKPLPKSDKP